MRKAFTLIELLVIVAIIGSMVTVSVLSVRAGQRATRVKGAARDLFAVIRHARSVALVTQQPSIITYSCSTRDGEAMAKIEITSAKILTASSRPAVETLSGEPLKGENFDDGNEGTEGGLSGGEGLSVEDVLFAPISEDVLAGMRIKVKIGDELETDETSGNRNKISVFSNVDYLLGKFSDNKKKEDESAEEDATDAVADHSNQEPISVVWEVNGRCEPHQVWIYPDGSAPDSGLCIKVDRFGGAKVLSGDGEEDEE